MTENAPSSVTSSIHSSIASSFNNTSNNSGVSINNKTFITNNFNVARPSKCKKDELPSINDQKALFTEVILNDQKVLELIWKYLNIEDKFNCTLVCKRFNYIVSEMEYFHLIVNLPSRFRVIPRLSRSYKTVIFQHYQCKRLENPMRKMLKHLSYSVIDLRFYDCQFNLMTLCEFINELPLLESLKLNMTLTIKKDIELFVEDIPKLLQLADLNIEVNGDVMEEILEMFGSTSNIKSLCLSLFDTTIEIRKFDYLKKYKSSLKSLSLTKCVINKSVNISNLNTLHLKSINKLPPNDFQDFDCLNQLRVLHLNEVNTEMLKILNSKCINWLTELEVIYTSQQKEDMSDFYIEYIFQNGNRRNIEIEMAELWMGPINKEYKSHTSYKNHIKYHRKNTDENVINSCFQYTYTLYSERFQPAILVLTNIILKWNSIDCVDTTNIFKIKMNSILRAIAEHDPTLAANWLKLSQMAQGNKKTINDLKGNNKLKY